MDLDIVWLQAWRSVEGAIVAVMDIFLYLVACFTNPFEIIFALFVVNAIVLRFLAFPSGSDVARKSLPGGSLKLTFRGKK